ncbi:MULTISPECIES: M20/M25/M40 family metallo-hydrolase [unclassified Caulobacter]|uniref:M20/M25/M40 family metallo-hydrolase n=1 Tax=unclassified Caulobacter TaxID=2648921 RepID=UPI000701B76D|nr:MULTISPECIES: M20/M25/M40 family metallo-hydrolase [unclassified Caulobacter]KQV55901.1 peptidase M20 [Caulobacter sp. Root342]KQV70925.1 peptidase M20 [Caulobacter sp. Root343]
MLRLSLLALAAALVALPAHAAPDPAKGVAKLVASPAFKAAAAKLDADYDRTVADIVALTEIPAPPFKEEARAKAYLAMLKAHGLSNVEMDAEGNVMGVRLGTATKGKGPFVVIAAHLDTVFPEGTDVKVKREGTRLMAPGIGDDTRSLATLLAYVRALDAAGIKTKADILFVGNVGEEGPGDLRGARFLFNKGPYKGRISAFFSMDGSDPSRIVDKGVGSKRYRVTFKGPGGHSYGAFGIVNPMAAMAQAVTDLYAVQTPKQPKTTYSASVTGGGTSVNSIPNSVFMEFDMRSESAAELAKLDQTLVGILDKAVAGENAARSIQDGKVSYEAKVIGERPAGNTPETADIVVLTAAAISALGFKPEHEDSSTDSNVPMSLGIPAVTIGAGGKGGRAHALDEWIDVEKAPTVKGMQVGLAALLAAAGME